MAAEPAAKAQPKAKDTSELMDGIRSVMGQRVRKYKRILALDGGGIYGLFTVLMLKELCKADPNFLKEPNDVVFAGTSAGALTSLALANQKHPRDLLLSGELEPMFTDQRLFAPKFGLGTITSYTMLTSWTGSRNATELLQEQFGTDKTLNDLEQSVMVCVFDMSDKANANKKTRHWRPRIFHNLSPDEHDGQELVWKIGYGAAAPIGWRTVMDGLTDGGIFANNASLAASGELAYHNAVVSDMEDKAEAALNMIQDETSDRKKAIKKLKNLVGFERGDAQHLEALKGLRVLSLGVGNRKVFYPYDTIDWGLIPYSVVPTNPLLGVWLPVWGQFLLQPAVEATTQTAEDLFGPKHFHRLDPDAVGSPVPPVLPAMYISRYRLARKFMAHFIRDGMEKSATKEALADAAKWIREYWYDGRG